MALRFILFSVKKTTFKRHEDYAHSDATSHEKLGLLKWTQNLGPLQRIALGDWLEDSRLQISAATSPGSERFFFSVLTEEERILLGPAGPRAGTATGTYSTRPSSMTPDNLTPGLDAVSLRGIPASYQRPLVSLDVRRRNTTRS